MKGYGYLKPKGSPPDGSRNSFVSSLRRLVQGSSKSENREEKPPPAQFQDRNPPPAYSPTDNKPSYQAYQEPNQGETTEDQLAILFEYDIVIILDDSGSMIPLWSEACRALVTLATVATKYDKNGIDVCFINSEVTGKNLRSEQDVMKLFEKVKVKPESATYLGIRLELVILELVSKIKRKEKCKNTNYLVITDGRPDDGVEDVIASIAEQLNEASAPLSKLGIQFVQIGQDPGAKKFLQELDDGRQQGRFVRDIVDTESFVGSGPNPELTGQRLIKLLLGGINRKVDRSKITS